MARIRVSSPITELKTTPYLRNLLVSYGLTTVKKLASCEGSTLRLIKGFGADKIRILAMELDDYNIKHRLRE